MLVFISQKNLKQKWKTLHFPVDNCYTSKNIQVQQCRIAHKFHTNMIQSNMSTLLTFWVLVHVFWFSRYPLDFLLITL